MTKEQLRKIAITEGIEYAKREGYAFQKIANMVLEEFSQLLEGMTEDQKYEYSLEIANEVEEALYID